MRLERRAKQGFGMYPGPILINLVAVAAKIGCQHEIIERILREEPWLEQQGRVVPLEVLRELVQKMLEQKPGATLLPEIEAGFGPGALSLKALVRGEGTLREMLSRAACTSLLDANVYATHFEELPHRKACSVTFLPIVPLPMWLHVNFIYMFHEGLEADYPEGLSLEVDDIVMCGERFSGSSLRLLELLTESPAEVVWVKSPTRITYKEKSLSAANEAASSQWRHFDRALTQPILAARWKSAPWAYRTYMTLLEHFKSGSCLSMEAISDALGVDCSTLRRHLQTESTGFNHLIDLFRNQQAQLMVHDGVSMERMAERLGYKNPLSVKRLLQKKSCDNQGIKALVGNAAL